MTTSIYEWPNDWYQFSRSTFKLTSRSQTTPRTWIGGKSVYGPHAQLWTSSLTLHTQDWDAAGQWMAAFFSRLDGQAALMRIGDPARRQPQYNRLTPLGISPWSDATFFDDHTGWTNLALPEAAFVAATAAMGDNYVIIGGLPASTARVFRRGDLIELRANGIITTTPNLYEVQTDGGTDSTGRIGVEIRPRLRQGFVNGDMAVLKEPKSVFRLVDDDQGAAEMSAPLFADIGFSLIEAII